MDVCACVRECVNSLAEWIVLRLTVNVADEGAWGREKDSFYSNCCYSCCCSIKQWTHHQPNGYWVDFLYLNYHIRPYIVVQIFSKTKCIVTTENNKYTKNRTVPCQIVYVLPCSSMIEIWNISNREILVSRILIRN